MPSLTGIGMGMDQIKYSYPCLPAFIVTEQWPKPPKKPPCHIAVECQTMKMDQPPQKFYKLTFTDWYRDGFRSNKIY